MIDTTDCVIKCVFCKAEFDKDSDFIEHVKSVHKLNMYSYYFYADLFESLAFGAPEEDAEVDEEE